MDIYKEIKTYIDENFQRIVDLRGHFHENPELSEKEFATRERIKEELSGFDISYLPVEGTSLIGDMDTGMPGKTLVLRSDMDALAISEREDNNKGKKKFVSKNPGVSHMCGHDAHMTILIESLKFLYSKKDQLAGRLIFVFEEAEETWKGIDRVLHALEGEKIDAVFGLHLVNFLDSGKFSLEPGPVMAGISGIDIDIVGRGGHGSRPDLAINPLFCGADIINTLGSLWANKFAPGEVCTLGLTNLIGGQAYNVIEERQRLVGTIRYFSHSSGAKGLDLIEKTATSLGQVHGCKVEINHKSATNPILVNDEGLSNFAKSSLCPYFEDRLTQSDPWYASETFARYKELAPSLFAFLGNRNDDLGITADNHNPAFDVDDERTLKTGISLTGLFAYEYLNNLV